MRTRPSLFIFLFQILKTIDSQQIADDIKKKYTNIIRSILPQQVLQLLMIACHKEDLKSDFYNYREFVEKYSLLEHIKFYESDGAKSALLLNASTRYDKKAFDQNKVFNQCSNSLIYGDFEKEHNFYQILYNKISEFKCVKSESGNEIHMQGFKDIDSVFKFIFSDVKRITEVYLNNSVIVDFRISENLLHIKTAVWSDCFKFSDNHILWMPSAIYEGEYFDNS